MSQPPLDIPPALAIIGWDAPANHAAGKITKKFIIDMEAQEATMWLMEQKDLPVMKWIADLPARAVIPCTYRTEDGSGTIFLDNPRLIGHSSAYDSQEPSGPMIHEIHVGFTRVSFQE